MGYRDRYLIWSFWTVILSNVWWFTYRFLTQQSHAMIAICFFTQRELHGTHESMYVKCTPSTTSVYACIILLYWWKKNNTEPYSDHFQNGWTSLIEVNNMFTSYKKKTTTNHTNVKHPLVGGLRANQALLTRIKCVFCNESRDIDKGVH